MFNIGIVGAGIGGLSAGLMLRTSGHKVTIFEKQSASFSSGVGIQVSSNAIRILREFDLEDEIIKNSEIVIQLGLPTEEKLSFFKENQTLKKIKP